jgi:hypothetical protein
MNLDEGVIKFDDSDFTQMSLEEPDKITPLEEWRRRLFELGLIGEYPIEKVGYGNVSQIINQQRHFLITGTQTGKLEHLSSDHYTIVTAANLKENKLSAAGPIRASSESLTHSTIYQCNPSITCVFHIHSTKIWEGMIRDELPATAETTPYGTFEMATEVGEIVGKSASGVIVMKGHQDGVIAYGRSLSETGLLIEDLYRRYIEP